MVACGHGGGDHKGDFSGRRSLPEPHRWLLSIFRGGFASPNPTTGLLNIEFNANTTATVDLYNVLGERVMTKTFNAAGLRTIDLGNLDNGVYYMNVTANGETVTKKVTLSK